MGKFPPTDRQKLLSLAEKPVDTYIPTEDLPFDMSLLGVNAESSMASVNMAERLGLTRVTGLGASRSLGPVFAKQL